MVKLIGFLWLAFPVLIFSQTDSLSTPIGFEERTEEFNKWLKFYEYDQILTCKSIESINGLIAIKTTVPDKNAWFRFNRYIDSVYHFSSGHLLFSKLSFALGVETKKLKLYVEAPDALLIIENKDSLITSIYKKMGGISKEVTIKYNDLKINNTIQNLTTKGTSEILIDQIIPFLKTFFSKYKANGDISYEVIKSGYLKELTITVANIKNAALKGENYFEKFTVTLSFSENNNAVKLVLFTQGAYRSGLRLPLPSDYWDMDPSKREQLEKFNKLLVSEILLVITGK